MGCFWAHSAIGIGCGLLIGNKKRPYKSSIVRGKEKKGGQSGIKGPTERYATNHGTSS